MLWLLRDPVVGPTTRGAGTSCSPGSRMTPSAWTTSSGCGGRAGSCPASQIRRSRPRLEPGHNALMPLPATCHRAVRTLARRTATAGDREDRGDQPSVPGLRAATGLAFQRSGDRSMMPPAFRRLGVEPWCGAGVAHALSRPSLCTMAFAASRISGARVDGSRPMRSWRVSRSTSPAFTSARTNSRSERRPKPPVTATVSFEAHRSWISGNRRVTGFSGSALSSICWVRTRPCQPSGKVTSERAMPSAYTPKHWC